MTLAYDVAKEKFDIYWGKTEILYRHEGLSDYAVDEIKKICWEEFKHRYRIMHHEYCLDDSVHTVITHFPYRVTVNSRPTENSSSDNLYEIIGQLTGREKNALALLANKLNIHDMAFCETQVDSMTLDNYPEMMTIADFSKYLRIHTDTAYSFIRKSKIPHARIGRQIRIRREDVRKLFSSFPAENNYMR